LGLCISALFSCGMLLSMGAIILLGLLACQPACACAPGPHGLGESYPSYRAFSWEMISCRT
jgi:hypothetical protein